LVPAIQRQARQLHAGLLATRCVDAPPDTSDVAERINPAVLRFNSFDQCGPFGLLGDVEMPVFSGSPGGGDIVGDFPAEFILQIAKHHAGAVAREYPRGCLPNTRCTTCYDGHLTGQPLPWFHECLSPSLRLAKVASRNLDRQWFGELG